MAPRGTLDLALNFPPFYKEMQGNLRGESISLSEVTAIFQAPLQL